MKEVFKEHKGEKISHLSPKSEALKKKKESLGERFDRTGTYKANAKKDKKTGKYPSPNGKGM